MFTFGGGSEGQLGHKEMRNIAEPKAVAELQQKFILSVACGPFHTAVTCISNARTSSDSLGINFFLIKIFGLIKFCSTKKTLS